ncbi:MAG: glycosyltransferase family 4 protein [bacterium]|nr:glycosyltransferase family 4 protein [bacterium]
MPENAPHILILSSWYPSEKQPFLGNFVRRQAHLLSQKYRVTVINLICCETIEKNQLSTVNDGQVTEIQARYPKGSRLSRLGNRSRVFSDALKSLDKVDIILGHVLLPHGWMFLQAQRKLKCPLIWIEHGSYFRTDIRRNWHPRERMLRRSLVLRANEIVAVSDVLRKDMQHYISSNNIQVIGNHVDEKLFAFKEKQPSERVQFLHVSTLDRKTKNPQGIIDACVLLKKEGASFHLTIVSDEDATEWIEYALKKDVSDLISFEGPKKWSELPKYYHQADAFVLNSEYETFSIVLAEALSTGTPIITTDVGISSEIPESAKIPVTKNDPHSLKEAIKEILQGRTFDHQTIAHLGEKYHSGIILKKWEQVISKHVR